MALKKLISTKHSRNFAVIFLAFVFAAILAVTGWTQVCQNGFDPQALGSLKNVPVPEPVNLADFVKDKQAAIRLGKALFWDMQLGSDGVTACATCHFHAGADNRKKNQVSPGILAGDNSFNMGVGPNGTVTAARFPTTQFAFPDQPGAELNANNPFIRSTNDVLSSMGVRLFQFVDIIPGQSAELATPIFDPVFNVLGRNTRRVEPRNSPTVINAVFYFSNFWDGRARNIFNGVNPFGELDEDARVFENNPVTGVITPVQVRIPDASHASQAVGPPLSDFEMSSRGRTFPKVGKKMLSLRPLAKQLVHSQDSALGTLSRAPLRGLNTSYEAMIKAAFQDKWWNNTTQIISFSSPAAFQMPTQNEPRSFIVNNGIPTISPRQTEALTTNQFTQMEANFSLFFGLATQLYQATLIANDSKFDKAMDNPPTAFLTPAEQAGFNTFVNQGRCINCHGGRELTNHSVNRVRELCGAPSQPVFPYTPARILEQMNMADRSNVIYDNGIYNIGVRPAGAQANLPAGAINEDIGRGNTAPIINPLTGQPYPLSHSRLSELKAQGLLPPGVALFVPDGFPLGTGIAVDGAQKTPHLRNVELTGPFLHGGSEATLLQVVQFYTRGGNFPVTNSFNLDPDVVPIGQLAGDLVRQNELVAFLKTLTDERVRNESAPFDRPELLIPNGSPGGQASLNCTGTPSGSRHTSFCDDFIVLPAVGAGGRTAQGLPLLGDFAAALAENRSISGRVTNSAGGVALAGVTITLTGPSGAITTTGANGNYTITGLADGAYTVTPTLAGFTFAPASRTVTIAGGNITGVNFVGTLIPTFSLSGTVNAPGTRITPGQPIAGVTMTLSGTANRTVTTNASGAYSFTGLANGNYTVTPSQAGRTFTPPSRTVIINNANVTGMNFIRN